MSKSAGFLSNSVRSFTNDTCEEQLGEPRRVASYETSAMLGRCWGRRRNLEQHGWYPDSPFGGDPDEIGEVRTNNHFRIAANLAWSSPETVQRFLKCPS